MHFVTIYSVLVFQLSSESNQELPAISFNSSVGNILKLKSLDFIIRKRASSIDKIQNCYSDSISIWRIVPKEAGEQQFQFILSQFIELCVKFFKPPSMVFSIVSLWIHTTDFYSSADYVVFYLLQLEYHLVFLIPLCHLQTLCFKFGDCTKAIHVCKKYYKCLIHWN